MIYEGSTNHRKSAPGVDETSWSDWWSQAAVNHSSFFKYMICTLGIAFQWDILDCFENDLKDEFTQKWNPVHREAPEILQDNTRLSIGIWAIKQWLNFSVLANIFLNRFFKGDV